MQEIKLYNENADGRVKVFFVVENNQVVSKMVGNFVPQQHTGFMFYVDDYVAEQIDKVDLSFFGLTPKLEIKDGETLFIPETSIAYKKQKEIDELEQKLQELKGDK